MRAAAVIRRGAFSGGIDNERVVFRLHACEPARLAALGASQRKDVVAACVEDDEFQLFHAIELAQHRFEADGFEIDVGRASQTCIDGDQVVAAADLRAVPGEEHRADGGAGSLSGQLLEGSTHAFGAKVSLQDHLVEANLAQGLCYGVGIVAGIGEWPDRIGRVADNERNAALGVGGRAHQRK